jgi:hypoxanthine phosphoribosyltransferase
MIPKGLIDDRTRKLAELIHAKLGDKPIVALCVLKGAFRFYNDLVDHLLELRRSKNGGQTFYHPIYYDFLRLKSYAGESSTGDVQVIGANPLAQLKGKHVLVVEDIVDTGMTMQKLFKLLEQHQPASISMVTMLLKKTERAVHGGGYRPNFIGFEIPDHFVVGFGLDYNEAFRDLNHICVLNDKGKEQYKE